MKVSTVGCTSLRPSQSSFKSKGYDENSEYSSDHRRSRGDVIKKLIIAGSVATAGTIMTKGISAKLLSKIKNDSVFAQKIGQKTLDAFNFLSDKTKGLSSDKTIQKHVKKFATKILDKVEKFASKGVDEAATGATKAANGVKKGLSWVAGGATAVESFKDLDCDSKLNGEEVANAGVRIIEAVVTGS